MDTRPCARANLIPNGWQLPEPAELRRNNDSVVVTNYMSAIAHLHQRPRGRNDKTPTEENDAASTRSRRPHQKSSTAGNGTARPHPTNIPPSSSRFKSGKQTNGNFKTKSGICGRAIKATSLRRGLSDMERRGRSNSGNVLHIPCCACDAALFDTLAQEFLMLIFTGRPKDLQLALRRREQREMKNQKSNVANFLEVQWMCGKAPPRRHRGTPWKKAPNDCDHPPSVRSRREATR